MPPSLPLRPLFKHRMWVLFVLFTVCMAILFAIAWFGRLPTNTGKPSSYQVATVVDNGDKTSINDTGSTQVATELPPDEPSPRFKQLGAQTLAEGIANLVSNNPNKTGIYPLNNGMDAFAARMLLISTAEKTLDLQYYILNNDITGNLMLQGIKEAAERGVRVRLLLDDNNTRGLDPTLWVLNDHANIEVRLMNPNRYRSWRWLGFVGDFDRLNHRMHNKSLTADSQLTITGGRNIGDEYFALNQDMVFSDMDVLMVGAIVPQVSQDFDRYWNHPLAYPITDLIEKPKQSNLDQVFIPKAQQKDKPASDQLDPMLKLKNAYLERIVALDFVNKVKRQHLPMYWATTELLSDNPDKLLGKPSDKSYEIGQSLGDTKHHARIVSAYFVPTQAGTDYFVKLAKAGADVRILTNAMSATDVKAVHSGYAKYRQQLLTGGVKLYELKPNAKRDQQHNSYLTGRSATSLHAKTFESDGERLYIGSYNFDPRSAELNTELGVNIHSPEMATHMQQNFDRSIATDAYTVTLVDDKVQWHSLENGKPTVYHEEPQTKAWERSLVWLLAKLPIEWLL